MFERISNFRLIKLQLPVFTLNTLSMSRYGFSQAQLEVETLITIKCFSDMPANLIDLDVHI
ncbi:CLUMA_CG006921, isoform A [Clunio marinus]|uniref:CLUMA_CG006921, isoform A n=1 Tax=Clunio marinus TaxID=568069 RepID=A0A1J1I4S9_9DIPT|nr:CLUMA_CG006921, isoform A [Clunio marinus]